VPIITVHMNQKWQSEIKTFHNHNEMHVQLMYTTKMTAAYIRSSGRWRW